MTNQALKMLPAFRSVAVETCAIIKTNLAGEKVAYHAALNLDRINLSAMIDAATAHQQNIIIRPRSPPNAELIQLDDIGPNTVQTFSPFTFLAICTSPNNFQAWLAVTDAPQDFARRLRKGAGADPNASGATRIAGSRNFKPRYAPDFPLVSIVLVNPGRTVSTAEIERFAAPADPLQPVSYSSKHQPIRFPSYDMVMRGAPRGGRLGQRRCAADFVWAMTAIDWGFSIEQTAARLMQESTKAQENGERYARRTAENAARAVAGRRLSPL